MFDIRYTPGVFSEGTYRQRIPSKQILYPSKLMIIKLFLLILFKFWAVCSTNNKNNRSINNDNTWQKQQ